MESILKWSARKVVEELRAGSITIEDTLDALEQHISAVDPVINALPTLCIERARECAEKLQSLPPERRGLLAGLPITIKDLTPVAGVRTTFGSKVHENHIPDASDSLVVRLEQQGGLVYAKSNTPEFGTGGITFNDVFGRTRSPRNLDYASGGSSGGAAASLAAGCAWLSHGSDMAGSLRTPATFCGVTSLRPSPGRIRSDSEYLPFAILGAEGPMARSVQDLALFADAMFCEPNPTNLVASQSEVQPKRIAFSVDLGVTPIDDAVQHQFDCFVATLERENLRVIEDAPDLNTVHHAFDVLRAHQYAINLEQTLIEHPGVVKPEIEWNIRRGLKLDAEEIRNAKREQGMTINHCSRFMQDYDLLVCPATSMMSVAADLRYPGSDKGIPYSEYYRWLGIAYSTTMTALPIVTMPVAITENGMPFAVQLIGRPFGESTLFSCARYIEKIFDLSTEPVDLILN